MITPTTQLKPVKCLVWDLDNTVWRGTLSEDSEVTLVHSIVEVLETLDSRGILNSIASKNDHEHAWGRLEELGIAEYFVLPHIGWGPKSASIRNISDKLNFAYAAMAFIDDQPTERAEVSFHLPQVRCYPDHSLKLLTTLPEFSPHMVTIDARHRRKMYQASFRRAAERATFAGPDEAFLLSLNLEMDIGRANDAQIARVEELTLRTSQMNATGIHYSAETLREFCTDPSHEVLVASLTDRFGPHGAVGVLLLQKEYKYWHIKLLATSCRVVSFGVGTAILNWLINQAAHAGVHLIADFRPTERNRMMEITYRFAGFTDAECACLPAATEGVQRMHLVSERRASPTTLEINAVKLTATQ